MKLNIGDKVMVKARGEGWNLGVDAEYVECKVDCEPHHDASFGCVTCFVEGPIYGQFVPVSAIKPIKKPLTLKDGKTYETADGVVFKVRMRESGNFDVTEEDAQLWHPDGMSFYCELPDLIRRHYTKPQPAHKLDLKKGDVVELVKWEDDSRMCVGDKFTFNGKKLKMNTGESIRVPSILPKGERPLFKVVSRA